jgi:hypothetical protein
MPARRWVVERTLAWITRCRRTVRYYERLPERHETIVYWAMVITMSRLLARRSQPAQPRRLRFPDRDERRGTARRVGARRRAVAGHYPQWPARQSRVTRQHAADV